jgi:hypothetical protein
MELSDMELSKEDVDRSFKQLPHRNGDLTARFMSDVIDSLPSTVKSQLYDKWIQAGVIREGEGAHRVISRTMEIQDEIKRGTSGTAAEDFKEFDSAIFRCGFGSLAARIYIPKIYKIETIWQQNLDAYRENVEEISYWLNYCVPCYKMMMELHELIIKIEEANELFGQNRGAINEEKIESLFSDLLSWCKANNVNSKEISSERRRGRSELYFKWVKRRIKSVRFKLVRLEKSYPCARLLELYSWLCNLRVDDSASESDRDRHQALITQCYDLLPVPSYKLTKALQERHESLSFDSTRLPPRIVNKHGSARVRMTELMFEYNGVRNVSIPGGSTKYCPIKWCERKLVTNTIYEHFFNAHSTLPTWTDDERDEYKETEQENASGKKGSVRPPDQMIPPFVRAFLQP